MNDMQIKYEYCIILREKTMVIGHQSTFANVFSCHSFTLYGMYMKN